MNKINKSIGVIAVVQLLLVILFSCIQLIFFNQKLYETFYKNHKTVNQIHMNREDLSKTTEILLDYIKDKDDTISLSKFSISNENVFNSREVEHMKDVKNLYQEFLSISKISFCNAVILLILLYEGNKISWKESIATIWKTSITIVILVISFILIYVLADFDNFWLQFHYLLFDNTLFFLSPEDSVLINMVPEKFFFQMILYTIILFIVVISITSFIVIKYDQFGGKQNDQRCII